VADEGVGPYSPSPHAPLLGAQQPIRIMAKSQVKAGGPTRGRKRVKKMGMGSGKFHKAKHAAKKS
jgi:hypothetical protein